MSRDDYISKADKELNDSYDEPMTLDEYVDLIFEHPDLASHAARYVLRAIESLGTRKVIEEGEEKERYRFFDDPYNNGEHAILGNTDVLNDFVDDLRAIATGRGKKEKIIWFDGPTATGKSELKRCLINGLREFSKTADGRRYTLEWNTNTASSNRGLSYSDSPQATDEDWYRSPIQIHPLSVFPENVRAEIIESLNAQLGDGVPINVDQGLDPFSREAFSVLTEHYRNSDKDDIFTQVTDPEHLRVKNYVMDIGSGIGVLHSEDEGHPNQRLVGEWMNGMLRELDSMGRKNPQAFDYNGVLSQGNGGITVVEEASQHADLLRKMLNVPDEQQVKLDKAIEMDIDTCLILISNPNLDEELNRHSERSESDPLKALKRRLEKHEFKYLTNISLEAMLLHRELQNEPIVWEADDYEDLKSQIESPLRLMINAGDERRERELAPHTVEAAALFNIVSRLDKTDLPGDLDLIDKAILFDRGYIEDGDERLEKSDFDFDSEARDGSNGIPITFTRDNVIDLVQDGGVERTHSEYPVEDVVMPQDVLNRMVESLTQVPVLSPSEAKEFEGRVAPVKQYIFDQQEKDVLDAMMRDKVVDKDTVEEYIRHIDAWDTDETVTNNQGNEVEPDPLKMRVFEVKHLGRFSDNDYGSNHEPSEEVKQFRSDTVMKSINSYVWENRDDEFSVEDIDPTEIDLFNNILNTHDWDAVKRMYEDIDPYQWENPPSDTETERVKRKTVQNMMEMFGYSRGSAELTSLHVIREMEYKFEK